MKGIVRVRRKRSRIISAWCGGVVTESLLVGRNRTQTNPRCVCERVEGARSGGEHSAGSGGTACRRNGPPTAWQSRRAHPSAVTLTWRAGHHKRALGGREEEVETKRSFVEQDRRNAAPLVSMTALMLRETQGLERERSVIGCARAKVLKVSRIKSVIVDVIDETSHGGQ